MNDPLSFLEGQSPVEPAAVADAPAVDVTEVETSHAAQERGAGGRFASKVPEVVEAAPAAPAAPVAAPAAVSAAEPGHVPISAMLDEREKRQALERQLAAFQARQAPPTPPTESEQVQSALYAQNLRASRRFAEREYGKEALATVHDWAARRCDEDPIFNQQMRSAEDPYEAAYQAYNRSQLEPLMAGVKPDDFAAFKAWQAAQAAPGAIPNPAIPPSTAPAAPVPRSLATAPGNGGAGVAHVPVGPGQAFAATINR